jgi:O-antigen ligase/Flp pilus assembly protein TadD
LPVPVLFFSVLIVYVGLILPKTALPQYSFDKLVQIIPIFYIFLFINELITGYTKARLWESVFIGVVLGLATLEFFFFFTWYAKWVEISGTLFSLPPVGYRIMGVVIPGANLTTGFLNLIFPLVLMRFIQGRKRNKVVWGIFLLLIGLIEFFASSRAGWIAALVGLAITIFLAYFPVIKDRWKKKKELFLSARVKTVIQGALAVGLFIIIPYLFVVQSENTTGHNGLLSGREVIWSNAIQIWSADLLTGRGPGTFPLYYAQLSGSAGTWFPDHAHNMWLQIGAETGVVGIVLVLAALLWLALACFRAWKRLSKKQETRLQLAAYIGVGACVIIQQQANYFLHIPVYAIYVLVLVILVIKLVDPPGVRLSNRTFYPVMVIFLFIFIGGSIYAYWGGAEQWDAYFAYQNDNIKEAQSAICQAANEAPQFTVYSFQCAVFDADLFYANGDAANLQLAIQRIQDGLGRDPYWPVHWSNLGILQWMTGDESSAYSSMRKASEIAPDNALFAINYGWMAEELNNKEAAEVAYQKAIDADPWLLESPFFQVTALRTGLLAMDYSFSVNDEVVNNLRVYQAIKSGAIATAYQALEAALELNPRNPESLALLGVIEQRNGETEVAWRHAKMAVFIAEMYPEVERNPRVYIWAFQVALAQEKIEEAAVYISKAFSIWKDKRQYDTAQYYYYVYHRNLQLQNFVPGYIRADITEEMASALQWLMDYYRNEGMATEANEIGLWLAVEGNTLGAR